MTNPLLKLKIPAAKLRALAVEAEADERTIRRRINGLPVRGMVGDRIDRVLARHPDLIVDGKA